MAASNKSFKKFAPRRDNRASTRIDNPGLDDVYLLQWSSNNQLGNLAKWKEHIEAHAAFHYKELSKMFRLNDYYVPPAVDAPRDDNGHIITAADDEGGYIADEYRARVRIRLQLVATMTSDRFPLYTAMRKRLSATSQQIMMCDESWAEIEANQDPLALWLLIQSTHLGGNGGVGTKVIPGETLRVLNRQLEKTIMGETENLANYLRRFQSAVEAYAGADLDPPEISLQVAIFLENLDDNRFRSLKSRIKNDYHQAEVAYPETVIEAFRKANDWELDNPTKMRNRNDNRVTTTTVAYHTEKDSKQRKSKKSSNNSENHSKKKLVCNLCSQPGHMVRDCPSFGACQQFCKEEASKNNQSLHVSAACIPPSSNATVTNALTLHLSIDADAYTNAEVCQSPIKDQEFDEELTDQCILLDNQSQIHIFKNKDLLHGIHTTKESIKITGQVDEASFVTSQAGYFLDMDAKVYTSDKAKANLLSYAIVAQEYEIDWIQPEKCFNVRISDSTKIRFREVNCLYVCNVDKDIIESTNIASYLSNSSYQVTSTTRELKQAELARVFIQRLGFPSNQAVVNLLQNGSILNVPVSSSDVRRAENIFGPNLPSLKGKTMKKKTSPAKGLEFFESQVQKIQEMHSDFFHVNEQTFLISVIRPLDLTLTSKVKSLKKKDMKKAFESQLNLITSRNFKVSHIYTDGGISCLSEFFGARGIRHEICGAGAHVPIVENKIKVLKNRMRSILSSLKFPLPSSLLLSLVAFSTTCINLVITVNCRDNTSPVENFIGRKIRFDLDLRVGFGDFVQCVVPDSDNSMQSRTTDCIALGSTLNQRGTAIFYDIHTRKIIHRDHWFVVPITAEIIDILKLQASQEPTLKMEEVETIEECMDDTRNPQLVQPLEQLFRPDVANIERIIDDEEKDDEYDDDSTYVPSEQSDIEWIADDPEPDDTQIESSPFVNPIVPEPIATAPTIDSSPINIEPNPISISSDHPPSNGRYPTRTNRGRHTSRFGYHVSIKKALEIYGEKGKDALKAEIETMIRKKVWTPVNQKKMSKEMRKEMKKRLISSLAFIKEKTKPDGTVDKMKARLVGGGHTQDRVLYPDSSSPTASITNVFIESAIAAKRKKKKTSLDIGSAYLNSDQKNLIYMFLDRYLSEILVEMYPEYAEFVDPITGRIIVQLNKALYGCVESARLWYENVKETLESIGYKSNEYDPCIFSRDENTIIVYVDDFLLFCMDDSLIDEIINILTEKYKDIKVNRGDNHNYLGMNFAFENEEVLITMTGYVEDLLKSNNVTGTSHTPASPELFTIPELPILPLSEQKRMHTIVAKLLYLGTRTRPDILLVVNHLSTRVNKFTSDDLKKLMKCLKYLNGTKTLGLRLSVGGNGDTLDIVTHADASFGVHPDGKGQTAIVTTLGKGAILSNTHKQKIVSKSSSESELIAASDGVSETLSLRNYLLSRNYKVNPATLGQDNLSTKSVIENGARSAKRMKHLNIRYFFIHHYIDQQQLTVKYIPTNHIVADLLTKPIQGQQFTFLRDKLLGCIPEVWNE